MTTLSGSRMLAYIFLYSLTAVVLMVNHGISAKCEFHEGTIACDGVHKLIKYNNTNISRLMVSVLYVLKFESGWIINPTIIIIIIIIICISINMY